MPRLGTFLTEHQSVVAAAWAEMAGRHAPAQGISHAELLDNIPTIIHHLARCALEAMQGGAAQMPPGEAQAHALQRLSLGYDLGEVVGEYADLRQAVLAVWSDKVAVRMDVTDVATLDRALDSAIALSVDRYVEARERTLKALDRISLAVIDQRSVAKSLDATLQALGKALLETTSALDSLVILLVEEGGLRVRTALGLESQEAEGFTLQIGEGFSGQIAAERTPLLLHDAATNPMVKSPFLRAHGTRALYGVPLVAGDELVGVAHMGSRTHSDFSEEDKLVFREMATRAAAFIAQAKLQEAVRAQEELHREQAIERGFLLAEAQRKAAELEAVIRSLPDAVYIGDAAGIKHANENGLKLLGFTSMKELDNSIADLVARIQTRDAETGRPIPPEDQVFSHALRGEAASRDVITRHVATGEDVFVRSSAAPVRVGDRVVGAVAVNVDITDRIRRQEETKRTMEFEKHLIGIVSHDLRTPIASIILTCQAVLRHDHLEERQTKAIVRALNSAERAARMISDLLDFTRARLSGIPVHPKPADMHAIVDRAVEEVHLAFADREVTVAHEGDGHGEWDADRVAQVVTNLTRNALSYSPKGTPVTVTTRAEDDSLVLTVHNGGLPIPAEKIPRIFEPMQRATVAGEQRNIGLGLYIVQAIVRAHGGRISVESSAEAGTTFTVRWPRHPVG